MTDINSTDQIRISGVTFRYSGIRTPFSLGPINATLPRGRVLAWVGHNGSGKSTLGRILCGVVPPAKGAIEGMPAGGMYYSQSVERNVFPELTIGQHFDLLGRSTERRTRLEAAFPEIAAQQHRYPDELSGGQLQLMGFVLSLLPSRSVYVFDEVLNHLDAARAERVLQVIATEAECDDRPCCVVITHDVDLVQQYAQHVYVFAEGQIVMECEGGLSDGVELSKLRKAARTSPIST